jgi:hypothetical protein
MFLNLSNHSSSLWTILQKEVALTFAGSIVDFPFPNVPPDADEVSIDKLAHDTASIVISMNPTIVHLMGELTLCYRLVNILKGMNIPVVASTTERDVVMEDNDVKRVRFRFVRFRHY